MRITVFGASGRTGLLLVKRLLDDRHEVRAAARATSKIMFPNLHLEVRHVNVLDADAVSKAVAGQDAVISVIGAAPQRGQAIQVYSQGTRHMIDAMRAHGVRRLLTLSSAGVVGDPSEPLLFHYAFKRLLRPVYDDMTRMENLLRQAWDLDWTVVRPARLTDKPAKGEWRVGHGLLPDKGRCIARADLAAFVAQAIDDPDLTHKIAPIAY